MSGYNWSLLLVTVGLVAFAGWTWLFAAMLTRDDPLRPPKPPRDIEPPRRESK